MENILQQYTDIKIEIRDLKERIERNKKALQRIREEGNVKDIVAGGMGGIQHYTIEGFPDPEYARKKSALLSNKLKLEAKVNELQQMKEDVDEFISKIEKSEIRTILRLYYIDELTWQQVANRMNEYHGKRRRYTEDTCRMKAQRFLKKF